MPSPILTVPVSQNQGEYEIWAVSFLTKIPFSHKSMLPLLVFRMIGKILKTYKKTAYLTYRLHYTEIGVGLAVFLIVR